MMCENKASEVIAKSFDSVVSKGLKKMKKCGEIEKNSGGFSALPEAWALLESTF